ncbi:MAG TPA: response regulator transcription factor [Chloroflexota bacterium]|nr:response regulator transcription factor [Chloroflexota bacterium]
MALPRILVVDDDPEILSVLRRGLSYAGYRVDEAASGEAALAAALEQPPDLVILDLMLPGIDGIEVCRRLRAGDDRLPILMLTAKGRIPNRIEGLDAGADDYLVKPLVLDELLAHIRALLRRAGKSPEEKLRFGDLLLDPVTRGVIRGTRPLDLTAKEFELLEFFLRHPRQVLSRDTIFARVWGSDFLGGSNLIDVHVMRLREKLEAGGESRLLHTLRGAGYSLREG